MPDQPAPPLTIRLFGPMQVSVQGQVLPALRSRHGYRLLALLVLWAPEGVERSWLAGRLWTDPPEATALSHLRNSLTDLRRALGPEARRLQSPTPRTLRLDLTDCEVDLLSFDAAIKQGDMASLEQAVELHRAVLLEGWEDTWVFQQRQPRHEAYQASLERLATTALAAGATAAAATYLRRAIAADPLRESAYPALMQALAEEGNYAAALQCYRDLVRLLQREHDVEPDPETTVLFHQIRDEARRRAASPAASSGQGLAAPPPVDMRSGDDTITFLFTDIEGSSRIWDEHPQAMKTALARHDMLLRQAIEANGGRVFKTVGDGFCADFPSAVDAAAAAISAQRALSAEPWGETGPLRARMALHSAEAQIQDSDYFGPPLNRISRLLGLGRGGQILLSLVTHELIRDRLPEGVELVDRGERQLPGLKRGEHVFELVLPGSDPGPPKLAAAGAEERSQCTGEPTRVQGAEPAAVTLSSVVQEPIQALETPVAVPAWQREPIGGSVPPDSQFYIERPADEQFRRAMARWEGLILVKGARQMGKTSLVVRGLRQARQAGARVVWTDLQTFDADHLESLDTFLRALAEAIADRLDLEPPSDKIWRPHLGESNNFARYFRLVVLARTEEPLVWGLDEVDRLFGQEFASAFFGMLRAWYNERHAEPDSPWPRLVLAIAYATEAHLFITDLNQSPFNVGTRLALQDFTLEQVEELNRRHGSPLRDQQETERFYDLFNGQPYLVRLGLLEMAAREMDFDTLEAEADQDEGIFGDHLRRILVLLVSDDTLREAVRSVLRGEPDLSQHSFYRLRSAGVLAGSSVHDVRLRCQLYHRYLARHLG